MLHHQKFHPEQRSSLIPVTALSIRWISKWLVSGGLCVLLAGCKGGGAFQQMSVDDAAAVQKSAAPPKFGGQEALELKRLQTFNGQIPEFTAITVLPGRGMDMVSIKANLPNRGEIELLSVPSLEQIATMMTGTGADASGLANMQAGAAFLAPFTGPLNGTLSPDGKTLTANIGGRSFPLPASPSVDVPGLPPMARYGLMHQMVASHPQINTMPDGGEVSATFNSTNFGGRWPGKLQMTIATLLSGRAIDLLMTARNESAEPIPVSLGWHPRFVIPSGNRSQVRMRLPVAAEVMEPGTAHLGTSAGGDQIKAENGFNIRGGKQLGTDSVVATLIQMKPALFDNGPTVELRDTDSDYGLRVVAMSPSINGMRIYAPGDKNWITVSPIANPTTPAGKALDQTKSGELLLDPGKTLQWRVRLELFAPSTLAKPVSF